MDYKTITPDRLAKKFQKRDGVLLDVIVNFGLTKDRPVGYQCFVFSPFSTTCNCAVIYQKKHALMHVDEIEINENFTESLNKSFSNFLDSVNAKRFYYIQSIFFDTDSAFIVNIK